MSEGWDPGSFSPFTLKNFLPGRLTQRLSPVSLNFFQHMIDSLHGGGAGAAKTRGDLVVKARDAMTVLSNA